MFRSLACPFAAILAAALLAAPAGAADRPERIVSINLCTDELLLALADPDQIASLSTYATDPELAFFADRALTFPHGASGAESVIALHPDLVLAGSYTKRETRETLKGLGFPLIELAPARSIEESVTQIRQVADLVGHSERGEALVGEIRAAEDRARAARPSGEAPTVVLYQRRGYVSGGRTLTAELLGLVGLDSVADPLTGGTSGFVPLEKLIASPPDYLVVDRVGPVAEDQGSALLAHPALAALYPPAKRILIPDRLTVCGGPSLPEALDYLSAAVGTLPR